MTLPTASQYLNVPGRPVTARETTATALSDYLKQLGGAASWLRLEHVVDPSRQVPMLELEGQGEHGPIQFEGTLENRMLEPLIITLRALATGITDLDTIATPAFLEDLPSPVQLHVVVSVNCPFCPSVSAIALRLATSCNKVGVHVIRADAPGAPKVQAVPTILDDDEVISSGMIHEMQLVEKLLARRGVKI